MTRQASENLKLAGNPVAFDDLMSYVFAELDVEYIPILCTIEGKVISNLQELHSTFVIFEGTLACFNPSQNIVVEPTEPSAHLAFPRQGQSHENKPHNNQGRGHIGNNFGHNGNHNNCGNWRRRGRARSDQPRGNKPIYQVCDKYEHSANACYS